MARAAGLDAGRARGCDCAVTEPVCCPQPIANGKHPARQRTDIQDKGTEANEGNEEELLSSLPSVI
jgi:hypothetical protein